MEHKNAGLDASEVAEVSAGSNISSVSPETPAQRPATSTTFQGWKPPARQQSWSDKPSPLFGSATVNGSSAASSAPFSFASSSAPGLYQFQFPPQESPPASGSNPSPALPSFGGSAPAFGCSIGRATDHGASSSPAFGRSATIATGGPAASAQAFGCSSSAAAATTTPAFGCSQQPLFATPATATRTAGVPAGFFNGFNQVQWAMPGCTCTHPWANNPRPLINAKRCYCGKVAGVRFSNTAEGTVGLFYCCPDYNEEAIRNGTQDRNYCTYSTEGSNGFALVRRCYCGKAAVLQKSERFETWGKLFYSCPEYREKEVVFGRCNRGHCSYIEWCSTFPAAAPAQLFG